MDLIRFPAKIRQFFDARTFEADIDLYFGVYTRRRITIANAQPDIQLERDYLNAVYGGTVVYLVVDSVNQKSSDLTLPVLVRTDCRGWQAFCPMAGERRR